MTPISIRNRSPEQSSAIQRQFRAARMKQIFDDIEAQLTDPVLLEMTRHMRDTVMSAPEFAEPAAEFTVNKEAWDRLQAHPDVIAAKAERPLSPSARLMMRSRRWEASEASMPSYAAIGQELLDAGLVARTIHQDGRITYRLTAAGKRWRAA